MAKPTLQTAELRERLSGLLSAWQSEIEAVMDSLEESQSLATTRAAEIQALEKQVSELAELRQRVHEKDLALEQLKAAAKEKDAQFAALEQQHRKARERVAELERTHDASDQPAQHLKAGQQAEFEAMRAELAARKSLLKSLRADAQRGKALEKESAENREVIATMKESIARHARTIAELRRSADRWERKYRRLAETGNGKSSPEVAVFADSDTFTDTVVEMFLDETMEGDGDHTIVIDMTEPLRKARDERRRKYEKG